MFPLLFKLCTIMNYFERVLQMPICITLAVKYIRGLSI